MFFKQVEGEAAIVAENGVYKQCDLYERHGELFVRMGGGFVRLMADASTSKAKARLIAISFADLKMTKLGKLARGDAPLPDLRPLPLDRQQQLLPDHVSGT